MMQGLSFCHVYNMANSDGSIEKQAVNNEAPTEMLRDPLILEWTDYLLHQAATNTVKTTFQ